MSGVTQLNDTLVKLQNTSVKLGALQAKHISNPVALKGIGVITILVLYEAILTHVLMNSLQETGDIMHIIPKQLSCDLQVLLTLACRLVLHMSANVFHWCAH